MNCKPGDIAVVIGDGPHAGALVEVLCAAPLHDFFKPNGALNEGMPPGCWVLKTLGAPFEIEAVSMGLTFHAQTMFPCMPDSSLRPLRGQLDDIDLHEEMEHERITHGT